MGEDDLGVKLFSYFQPQNPVVQAKGPDASLASILERISPDGTDWTYIYGDSLSTGTLARHLGDAFLNDEPGVCIFIVLDREMLIWDSAANEVLPSTAYGSKYLYGEMRWPIYFAFDMVMLNGKPYTAYALESRWRAMDKAVVGTRNRLKKHTATPMAMAEDLE